jgi:hypothetical protein
VKTFSQRVFIFCGIAMITLAFWNKFYQVYSCSQLKFM